jgi:hypothetical protein
MGAEGCRNGSSRAAHGASAYSRISLARRSEPDKAISEAERGDTDATGESSDDLLQRYRFAKA